jgi:site-specific recombinase XerD
MMDELDELDAVDDRELRDQTAPPHVGATVEEEEDLGASGHDGSGSGAVPGLRGALVRRSTQRAEGLERALASSDVVAPPLAQNPAAVYLASLDMGSRRTMRQALCAIAALVGVPPQWDVAGREITYLACPWGALRYAHTSAVRAALAGRYAPATANKMLSALRRVLQEAWRLGQLGAEDYARARDLPPITGVTLPAGRAISGGELAALLAVCSADHRPAGVRDAAVIATLYSTLARRSELVAFQLEDYDPEQGALRVLHGKGRKARFTYLAAGASAALDAWLTVRGRVPGPLFVPLTKSGKTVMRPLRPQAVAELLARRAEEATVAACSPHDLRRSGIGDLLDAGADIATVQQLAGHADPATTSRYDRRGERAKRRATDLLHVPYVPRMPPPV